MISRTSALAVASLINALFEFGESRENLVKAGRFTEIHVFHCVVIPTQRVGSLSEGDQAERAGFRFVAEYGRPKA